MATNNFKAFGIGAGANVTSQSDYELLAALLTGFQSGKASSSQINKALRQSSTMAYVLAQYISDSASVDVLDNGNPATILANLKASITKSTPGRLINIQIFAASGTYTPSAGAKTCIIEAVSGGGGGGSVINISSGQSAVGNGGVSGEYVRTPLINAQAQAITIGAAGSGGTAGNPGNAGGATLVGSIISLRGGPGGGSGSASTNNLIAQTNGALSGTLNYPANSLFMAASLGPRGLIVNPGVASGCLAGSGGSSPLGKGAEGTNATSNGSDGSGYGSGGSGAINIGANPSRSGGSGTGGVVIIWEYA